MELSVFVYGLMLFALAIGIVLGLLLALLLKFILGFVEPNPEFVDCSEESDTIRTIKAYYTKYSHLMSNEEKEAYKRLFKRHDV